MGGARVILCTAPNAKAISDVMSGLARNGQAIIVAASREPIHISPSVLIGSGRSIIGSAGGGLEESLNFSALFKVIPMVEIFSLEQVAVAYDKMINAKVHFRSVLKIAS